MARRAQRRLRTIPAVRPNAGITAAYKRKLTDLVDEMHNSFVYWIGACYKANEPAMAMDAYRKLGIDPSNPNPDGSDYHLMNAIDARMAMDATPAAVLQKAIRNLTRRWQKRFNEGADDLARYFARSTRARSDAHLKAILKRMGFSVKFQTTAAMRDVMRASVEQNVQLIRSIPQQYLTGVQGAVMRSVQTGRDLSQLTRELQREYGSTRKRAALIALDQNNKATSAMQKVRQVELGITEGIWMHSHAGKEPRPTHLANDLKKFDIARGWFDPDPRVRRHIMPGELIRCRCSWKAVVPGFS